jgi:hypothetical protein
VLASVKHLQNADRGGYAVFGSDSLADLIGVVPVLLAGEEGSKAVGKALCGDSSPR